MAWFRRKKETDVPTVQPDGEVKTVKTEGLFVKCPGCERTTFKRDFEANLNVCPDCGHHLRVGADVAFALNRAGIETPHMDYVVWAVNERGNRT